jgi:hypothetical protein
MSIKIFKTKVPKLDLDSLAQTSYGDMVKGVVDINKKILVLGGDLHADCEDMLLQQGSKQIDLWGFNIYPAKNKENRLHYESLINIRPKQGNFQIEIKDEKLRQQIKLVIDSLID